MKTSLIGAIASMASLVHGRSCQSFTVPVTISSQNSVFNIQTPVTDIDATNFILNLTQPKTPPFSMSSVIGSKTVSGTYKIAATLCHPDKGQSDTVQLLTHGIGFDRSYWDAPIDNYNYSYVAVAVDHYGYSTFSYDRLGIGQSSHGDPLNEIQIQLELAALHALTTDLRAGKVSGCEKAFKNVVHVGHSFGSLLTYALTQQYPSSSNGIALTGFSQNSSFIPYFGLGANFVQASDIPALKQYPKGYLANAGKTGVEIDFFAPNSFDPAILDYATKTGQPVTVGELLTQGFYAMAPNTYAGPVLVITGERDIPFCGGNCYQPVTGYSSIPAAVAASFPKAENFTAVVVPRAGHGLNLEYSHPFTYKTVNDYFKSNA